MSEGAISESDRQQALLALRDEYATDQITLEEFGSKLDQVLNAAARTDLERLVPRLQRTDSGTVAVWSRPDEAAEVVEHHLQPGEELLWTGRPDPTKRFTPSDRFLVPFSIFWGGFALIWEGGAISSKAPAFFALFGLVFVIAGLYFMFGRFLYKAYRKRRTIYAVTNRRVMSVLTGSSGESVESMYLRAIPSVNVNARPDGTGTVMFTNTPWMIAMYLNSGMEFFARSYGGGGVNFFDIPHARAVAHLVDSLAARGA